MPQCCAHCDAAFDARTQQQLRALQRMADLGLGLAEVVAEFPLRTRHLDANDSYHFEVLTRGVRRSLALECKLTEDARKRHARDAHGAPAPRVRSHGDHSPCDHSPCNHSHGDHGDSDPFRGDQPAADEPSGRAPEPLTAEDEESVIGPEPVVTERAEDLLIDMREQLLDPIVDNRSPAVVATRITQDLETVAAARGLALGKEDMTVFLEPVPTRAILMDSDAADRPAAPDGAPWARDAAAPRPAEPSPTEAGEPPDTPPPVAKVRDPP